MWPTGEALERAAGAAEERAALRRPALLRFVLESPEDGRPRATVRNAPAEGANGFMGTLQALLPARLHELDAHRATAPGEAVTLYQPAQYRLYLVAASLVCQMPGLPDHRVDVTSHERAGFVVRRLTGSGEEEAWAARSDHPQEGRSPSSLAPWLPLSAAECSALAQDEDVQWTMFPVPFEEGRDPRARPGSTGRKRRLYAAVVPAIRRDAFVLLAKEAREALDRLGRAQGGRERAEGEDKDALLNLVRKFKRDQRMLSTISRLPAPARRAAVRLGPDSSRDALGELATFLRDRLGEVWAALQAGTGSTPGGGRLLTLLRETATAPGGPTWASALQIVGPEPARGRREERDVSELQVDLSEGALEPTELWDALGEALVGVPVPEGFGRGQFWGAQSRYVLRCVYERRASAPAEVGVSEPARPLPPGAVQVVVSDPSRPFRLAGFFDEEESVPSRPVAPAEVG
jgi:hypothetical protein